MGGAEQVREMDLLGLVVEDRRLDRPLEELVGVAGEELVQRVLAGDVDGQARAARRPARPHIWRRLAIVPGNVTTTAASSAPTSIPSSSASVVTTAAQLAGHQPCLDLAPLRWGVAGPVGRDPLAELARAEPFELERREAAHELDALA